MDDKYTVSYPTVKESQPLSAFCKLAEGVFTTCSPHIRSIYSSKRLLSGQETRWLLGNKQGTVKPTASNYVYVALSVWCVFC